MLHKLNEVQKEITEEFIEDIIMGATLIKVVSTVFATGPDSWHEVHEDCMKNRQSPINIVTRKTKLDHNLTPLVFHGYQQAFSSTLKNNGHSGKGLIKHINQVKE